jgi:hypothetical protein
MSLSLLKVSTARLLVAMLGDLGVSTLRSIKTMTPFSSFSRAPAMLPISMLEDYSTSVSSTPSCFLRRTDLLGNPFLITSLLDLLFLFWIIIPAILPTMTLGYYSMSASLMPSEFFIVVSIYWKTASYWSHSTSLRSARLQTGRLLGCLFFFLFDERACYSTCR